MNVEDINSLLDAVRAQSPLVHNITNYVVMNYTANALLAVGASPIMAHALEEVEEMTTLSGALVLNIGTLSTPWIEAMFRAAQAAQAQSRPVILDPVGAGASQLRTDTARRLLESGRLTVIRGNASEILAVAGGAERTRGVDSVASTSSARDAAIQLARQHELVVSVTGAEDFVTDGERAATIANGHPLMGRVTGTGCVASALTGAFCAVTPDAWLAATAALVVWGIAGELAAHTHPRPGTYQTLLLDALDEINGSLIRAKARFSVQPATAPFA